MRLIEINFNYMLYTEVTNFWENFTKVWGFYIATEFVDIRLSLWRKKLHITNPLITNLLLSILMETNPLRMHPKVKNLIIKKLTWKKFLIHSINILCQLHKSSPTSNTDMSHAWKTLGNIFFPCKDRSFYYQPEIWYKFQE